MNCVIIQQIAIQKNLDDAIISNILGCLDIRQKYDKIFEFTKYISYKKTLKNGKIINRRAVDKNKELYNLLKTTLYEENLRRDNSKDSYFYYDEGTIYFCYHVKTIDGIKKYIGTGEKVNISYEYVGSTGYTYSERIYNCYLTNINELDLVTIEYTKKNKKINSIIDFLSDGDEDNEQLIKRISNTTHSFKHDIERICLLQKRYYVGTTKKKFEDLEKVMIKKNFKLYNISCHDD